MLLAAGPDMAHLVLLLLLGGLAGLLGGLLGIGGGLVMIPAMILLFGERLYGVNSIHVFKLAALGTAVVLSIPAIAAHARARAVVPRMLAGIILFGLVGVGVGVGLGRLFANEQAVLLRRLFGAFMLVSVAVNLWRRRKAGEEYGRDHSPVASRWAVIGSIVGMPAGVIAGLLGVGGGVWAVPVQNYVLGVRLPNAIANSACMIIALAAGASAMQSVALTYFDGVGPADGWWLALWLSPGAVIGGWFGARLTHRLPVAHVRNTFYVLLVITGLKLVLS